METPKMPFIQKFALFIRTQGVIGLAVAVVIGGAVQKVVSALVNDIVNPFIGLFLGDGANLKTATFTIKNSVFAWGDLVSNIIDFLVVAFIIYLLISVLNVQALDKKKE